MKSEPHPESPASMVSVEQELLPCPFCGSDADVEHLKNGRWSAGCVDPDGDCMGFQSLQTFPRKIVAINAWNTRHQSLSRSAGGANPPTIDAPERRVFDRAALARVILDGWTEGNLAWDEAGSMNRHRAKLTADAILALLAASSGERGVALEEARAEGARQLLGAPEDWAEKLKELYGWTGSAWIADDPDDASDADRKSELYGFLCGLIGWLSTAEDAARALATPATVEEPKV